MNTPSAIAALLNSATRNLSHMFPGVFQSAKHNHYQDFGYPETLSFNALYAMYDRHPMASAAAQLTSSKTWQDNPQLWETEDADETQLESDLRQHFDDIRLWQAFEEADLRAFVGGYAGLILRFADSKPFSAPVDRVPGGLLGLVEVIPAWAGQLQVAEFNYDTASPEYGKPKSFQFNESAVAVGGTVLGQNRSFTVHPDRVLVWSKDGTVHCPSSLRAGFNALIDLEKVSGAGGEGFWKASRGSQILKLPKEAKLTDLAKGMGVAPDKVFNGINEQVKDFQRGFDQAFVTQGMEVETLTITMPIPEHFFNNPLQLFAASVTIPVKILTGNQTGERASSEDGKDWAQYNMSRRKKVAIPGIHAFLRRLEAVGILPDRDWHIEWTDLTESSIDEKMERASKMVTMNRDASLTNELVFTPEEVRQVVGYDPIELTDGMDDGLDDETND